MTARRRLDLEMVRRGLVSGRTQTIHSWNDRPGSTEPALWHHDLLRQDGSAFESDEIEEFRRLTSM